MLSKAALATASAILLAIPAWWTVPASIAQAPQDGPETGKPADLADDTTALPARNPDEWFLDDKWHGLYGAWSLMNFEHATELVPAEALRGYVTFQEGFMTLTIHALSLDEDQDQFAQSGIHRYQVTEQGILQTATVMAHSNFNADVELEWETPNIPREFRIDLNKDDLVLTKPDQSRLIFRRVKPAPYPQAALDLMREARAGLEAE